MWILMENPLGFPPASQVGGRSFLLHFNGSRREWKASGQKFGFPARKENRPVETDALWKRWKNQRAKAIFPPFPQRLENSPQKALRVSPSSHRPTAAAITLRRTIFYPKNGEYPCLLLNFKCSKKCPV